MNMDFKNMREVFSHNRMRKKTSLIFFNGATSRENRSHLRGPYFQILNFLLQSRSCRSYYGQLGMNLVKPKEVFVHNISISNKILQFFPRCQRWRENHVCSEPFFTENQSAFYGRQDPNSTKMNEADTQFEAAVEEDQGAYGILTRGN